MAAREFSEYKYDCGVKTGGGLLYAVAAILAAAVFFSAMVLHPALLFLIGIPLLFVIFLTRRSTPNVIVIGIRYLVVGTAVIYYQNVVNAILDREHKVLNISTGDGRKVEIRADRFPTNARKPEKIAKNKNAKFDKASQKIMDKLKAIVPKAVH